MLDTLLHDWLGVSYTLYHDEKTFLSKDGSCKLEYSRTALKHGDHPRIFNSGFLEGDTYRKCKVKVHGEGKDVLLFPGDGDFGFDLLAAMFFCLSRYEEYSDAKRDEHGRFPAKESLAYAMGFLEYPVVDQWRIMLVDHLCQKWKMDPFKRPEFKVLATVDVDNATAFAHKGFFRTILGLFRSLFVRQRTLPHRLRSLFSVRKDPYYTYEQQWSLVDKYKVPYIHFVLCAALSSHDRSLSPDSDGFRKILRGMKERAFIGWHPSYAAYSNVKALMKEKKTLEGIIDEPVYRSRQHYIRIQFPKTYRQLVKMGIKEDYSMGFPERPGFRAGTSLPFRFFDVEANTVTDLKIFPFPFLDTYYSEKKALSPEKGLKEMKVFADRIKSVNGHLILVWHNRTFSELEKQWQGWVHNFEEMLKYNQQG
ncbi:MAG: polysaccharide deacetylase family protein [Cryomorphaceae bacterium]|nr:polysaccharide deacetylase family protein [Cryomorphaceae bacterium]